MWKEGKWPKKWIRMVVPIKKKGEEKRVEEYRGITITDTM